MDRVAVTTDVATTEVVLLHGGEGWVTGDTTTVTMEGFNYTIRVEDHESTDVNATVSSAGDGLIRPEPTPFDADTAVTADTIIGGIIAELPSGVTGKHIGTGIYLSSSNPFSVEVVEEDLMRCFQASVNDVQNYLTNVNMAILSKLLTLECQMRMTTIFVLTEKTIGMV